MGLGAKTYIYVAITAVALLANFALWRYRLHLYDLNSDYDIYSLQNVQGILFRGTLVFIVFAFALLVLLKSSEKK